MKKILLTLEKRVFETVLSQVDTRTGFRNIRFQSQIFKISQKLPHHFGDFGKMVEIFKELTL